MHQGPGQWEPGESDWIDRVLDRAVERIEAEEIFDDEAVPVTAPRGGAVSGAPAPLAPSVPPSNEPVWVGGVPTPDPVVADASAPIPAPNFEVEVGKVAAAAPISLPEPAAPALTLGPDLLTPAAVGRGTNTDQLAAALEGNDATDGLNWFDGPVTELSDHLSESERPAQRSFMVEWGPVLVLAIIVAFVFRMFLLTAFHIPSLSMAPALDIGDRVVVNRLSYRVGDIERGQMVVFARPEGQLGQADHLIKRVIGLPGETVTIANGHVWIDGLRLDEPYLAQEASTDPRTAAIQRCESNSGTRTECVVPPGTVFVMGDNRKGSVDSRVFGPIGQESIVGRAFVLIWDLDNVGWL